VSIVRTDSWLDEFFDNPITICSKLVSSSTNTSNFYRYLIQFGMYRPNNLTKKTYHQLKKEKTWDKVEAFFFRYKQKWNGPDIPIYLFPIHHQRESVFKGKSGLSFHDKMFLFLSPLQDRKELEALFIHEYHHVCRMKNRNKPLNEYTLLDSIIMEGLAEYAVMQTLGKEYSAHWISRYKDKDLSYYWEKYFSKNYHVTRKERLHDALLFGKGHYPDLLGYAVGYWLVNKYVQKHSLSIRDSITLSSEKIMSVLDDVEYTQN
jgi:uncharacterized protein YjaZ